MQNETQYDLDRKTAKISALSSNNLDKYEYLTGQDLSLKPNTIEQAKFEYSPLGKISNRGSDKDDKKEGLFKRLKILTMHKKTYLEMMIKWSNPGHFLKSQGNFFLSFPCSLFLHIFDI